MKIKRWDQIQWKDSDVDTSIALHKDKTMLCEEWKKLR